MDGLAGLSVVEQRRLLRAGDVTATELRDAAVAACERLDPTLHFLASPLLDRDPVGVPMLLKDAGQEVAGTPHFVGVAALRDAGSTSPRATELARRAPAAARRLTVQPSL
jgi:amidase